MSGPTLSTSSGISGTFQTYYQPKFLAYAINQLFLANFAQKSDLPKNVGAKTVTFTRPGTADGQIGDVATLTEGTALSTFTTLTATTIVATLAQYGAGIKISDILGATGLNNWLKQGTTTLGEMMALHLDNIIRTALADGTNGLTKRYAQATATFAGLAAASASAGKLTVADLLAACTFLRNQKAPTIKGEYPAILAPSCAADVMQDSQWINVKSYSDAKDLYAGEVGMIYGVRVVLGTNAWTEDETEGTLTTTFSSAGTNTTGFVYNNIVTGADSYGVPNLASQSPFAPKMFITDKADSNNPVLSYVLVAWKAFFTALVLNKSFGVALRAKANLVP
jgi:N4-gp56 family major capsid protein